MSPREVYRAQLALTVRLNAFVIAGIEYYPACDGLPLGVFGSRGCWVPQSLREGWRDHVRLAP